MNDVMMTGPLLKTIMVVETRGPGCSEALQGSLRKKATARGEEVIVCIDPSSN